MHKSLLFAFIMILAGCTPDAQNEVPDSSRIDYLLISHAGFDSLPANNVSIQFKDNNFSGQGPVNRFFGSIQNGRIMPPIGSTMMAGPDELMQYEIRFLKALDSANVEGIGNDTLRLTKNGSPGLIFIKIDTVRNGL